MLGFFFVFFRPKMHAFSVLHATEVMCMQNKVNESLITQKENKLTVIDFSELHLSLICC